MLTMPALLKGIYGSLMCDKLEHRSSILTKMVGTYQPQLPKGWTASQRGGAADSLMSQYSPCILENSNPLPTEYWSME